MPEGLKAKEFLQIVLKDTSVKLWGPKDEIETDRYNRLLAVPLFGVFERNKEHKRHEIPPPTLNWVNLSSRIILDGHSVYWRKYGDAHKDMHDLLLDAEKIAKEHKAGAWATAPKWMQDKSNERTKPKDETKDAIKQLDNAIVDELYKAAVKEGKTHWKSKSGVRHNKDCQWFGKTKDGVFCKADEGVACGKCGG